MRVRTSSGNFGSDREIRDRPRCSLRSIDARRRGEQLVWVPI